MIQNIQNIQIQTQFKTLSTMKISIHLCQTKQKLSALPMKCKKKSKRFYQKYLELRRRINAHSYPALSNTINAGIIGVNTTHTIAPTTSATTTMNNFTVQRSASLKDYKPLRYEL